MASYYKNARRWQREHRSSRHSIGGETITMPRAKDGTFQMAPMRPGGSVPATGSVPQGGISGLPAKPRSDRYWKEYNIPSANRPGGLGRFRGLGGGALGFLMENADEFAKWGKDDWDRFLETGDLPEPFGFLNRKVYPPGVMPIPQEVEKPDPDGEVLYAPPGYELLQRCYTGTPPNETYLPYGDEFTTRSGQCNFQIPQRDGRTWENFKILRGSAANMPNHMGMGSKYYSNWRFQSFWSKVDGQVAWDNPLIEIVPTITTQVTIPGQSLHGDWSAPSAPDPNTRLRGYMPPNLWNSLKEATGDRFDSGYNPDEMPWERHPTETTTVEVPSGDGRQPPYNPGTVTRPSEPYRPPGKKPDRKAMIYGRGLFAAAQRGFHALTEYGDFIESFYDALPKKYQTCKVGGPACQTAMVLAHWDEVHIPTAVVNWLWNDFEDKMIGKFNAGVGNAAGRLGTTDWKLLNSMNESPLDEGLGELYGNFVKDHVNPTKKDFVAWAERNLF